MKVHDIYESYGNVEIPDAILIRLGIKEEDVMLNAEEVKKACTFFSALCCN